MTDEGLLQVLHDTADAVAAALRGVRDWGPSGVRDGQYAADLVADGAALAVLNAAGFGVLSEESGLQRADRTVMVIVDPLDGSTNASRGIPWYATALCALDADGARAALVVNQASGVRYSALRGAGAHVDGRALAPSRVRSLREAVLGLNGFPERHFGWAQYRSLGAAALDLCLVAEGVLDGYVDCAERSHGVWDYAASLLICREAGAFVQDAFGRELLVRDPSARRTPLAAGTQGLLAALCEARVSPS
jgi:fructose-1,6-bisphosphatase/inositol monophosphatase family enzyme